MKAKRQEVKPQDAGPQEAIVGVQPKRRRPRIQPLTIIRIWLLVPYAIFFLTLKKTDLWPDGSRAQMLFKFPDWVLLEKVKVGDPFPNVELILPSPEDPTIASSIFPDRQFSGKKVLILSVSHAFSSTCSQFLADFLKEVPELMSRGVSQIVVVSVDTPYVMDAWAATMGAGNQMVFLADSAGALAKTLGTTFDSGVFGFRGRRYAMVVDDLVITHWSMQDNSHSFAKSFLAQI